MADGTIKIKQTKVETTIKKTEYETELTIGRIYWTDGLGDDGNWSDFNPNREVVLIQYLDGKGFLVSLPTAHSGCSNFFFVRTLWADRERKHLVASFGARAKRYLRTTKNI